MLKDINNPDIEMKALELTRKLMEKSEDACIKLVKMKLISNLVRHSLKEDNLQEIKKIVAAF